MGNYLRCPMEFDGRSTVPLKETVEKVVKCISSCKFYSLSHMGRCVLINSVLVALASHIMLVYLFPKKVLPKINSTIFRFFWGGSWGHKPIYWIKGATLKQSRFEGGFSIRDVESLNLALLFKQTWRLEKNQNLLADRVFNQKYGGSPISLTTTNVRNKKASWAAQSLIKSAAVMKTCIGFRVRNGQNVKILEDKWVKNSLIKFKDGTLQVNPPRRVSELLLNNNWNAGEVRRWFYWDTAQKIFSIHMPQYGGREYSVKSGYWQLEGKIFNSSGGSSFWNLLCKAPISQRWRWFCWRLVYNALPTRYNLWKRKVCTDTSCIFCGEVKTARHLLIHCELSKRVWKASALGINTEDNM
ncbi:hypothetical protein RDABS01_013704 [Bienertia sinuspersici]